MKATTRRQRAPSILTITFLFVALSAAVAGIAIFLLIGERVQTVQRDVLVHAASVRGRALHRAFLQAIDENWRDLKAVAESLETDGTVGLRTKLDTIVGDGHRVAWAGYAGLDGRVVGASKNMLLGVDVTSRPWFSNGLEGPFAGGVHDAVLLARLISPAADGGPVRFIDLALPVKNAAGETQGVLGLHINVTWVADYVRTMARVLEIDGFMVGRGGDIVAASAPLASTKIDVPSIRAAEVGAFSAGVERWPDGKLYFAATVPDTADNVRPDGAKNDLPEFGWSAIARLPESLVYGPEQAMSQRLAFYLLVFGLLLLLLTAIFIYSFVRPFKELADNAVRVAEGKDVYPFESGRARELQQIGYALARLQSRMHQEAAVSDRTD